MAVWCMTFAAHQNTWVYTTKVLATYSYTSQSRSWAPASEEWLSGWTTWRMCKATSRSLHWVRHRRMLSTQTSISKCSATLSIIPFNLINETLYNNNLFNMGSKASTTRCELCHEDLTQECLWCKNYGQTRMSKSNECPLVTGVCGH